MSLVSANQASAAVISQYFDSLTNTSFTAAGVATSTSTPATVGQFQASFSTSSFDPSFGTLNSITITTSVSGSISALVSGAAGDVYSNVVVSIPFTLTNSNGLSEAGRASADSPSGTSANGSGPGFSGTLATSGTNTVGTDAFTLSGPALSQTLTGSQLTSYISSGGTVSFAFTTGSANVDNGTIPQNDLVGARSSEQVKVTVSADYTPTVTTVPEPATLALLGVGLLSAGLVRRRSR